VSPQLWIVRLTFIHPTVTRQLLEILPCRTFPDIPSAQLGTLLQEPYPTVERSLLDPSIICYTGRHRIFTIIAVVGLCVWSFGPVVAALAILRSQQRSGRLYSRQTRKNLGFLYNGYRRSFYFWDAVFALRRILTLIIAQVGASLGDEVIQLVCWQLVAGVSLILQLWLRPFDGRSFNILNRMEAQGLLIWNVSLWALMLLASTAAHPNVPQQLQRGLGFALAGVIVLLNAYHIIALLYYTIHHSLDFLMTSILLQDLPDESGAKQKKRDGILFAAMRRVAFMLGDLEDKRRLRGPTVRLDAGGSELTILIDTSDGGGKERAAPTPSGTSGSRRPGKRSRSCVVEGAVVASSLPLPVPMTSRSAPPAAYNDVSVDEPEQRLPEDALCLFPPSFADEPRSLQPLPVGPHLPTACQPSALRGDAVPAADSLPPDRAPSPQIPASLDSLPASLMETSQQPTATDLGEPPTAVPTDMSGRSAYAQREVWRGLAAVASKSTPHTMRAGRVESDRRKRWCSEVMNLTSESMQGVIEQVGIQAIPSDFVEFLWHQTFQVHKARKRTIRDPSTGNERIVLLPSLELRVGGKSSLRRGSSSFVDLMKTIQEEPLADDNVTREGIPFTDFQGSMAFVVDRLINAGAGWKDMYAAFRAARQADKANDGLYRLSGD